MRANGNGNGRSTGHTILLGGLGGDSHSVGLTILRQALSTNGYKVCYLGTQNCLQEFFELASLCNVVMISSMDGHSRYYLRGFQELMNQYKSRSSLWYLGGNLDVGDANGLDRHFVEAGFNRVFVKFVDINSVLETLSKDLATVEPVADYPTLWEALKRRELNLPASVSDEVLDPEVFEAARREVLQCWKTGNDAKDMEENAEFLGRQPSFPKIQSRVNSGRHPILAQPRSGVPVVQDQIRLFTAFKNVGARVLSYQVDSLTRNNNYVDAEIAIRESYASGRSTLNGFPVINNGVGGLRRIISEVQVPLQTRHSTRDPRLLAEISYAGGVTAFEGGAICYNIPYYKNYPPDQSIAAWQYVDYLTGLYFKRFGIVLDREFFGTLTATLIPPCLAIATGILEAILAIQQGVKCVSLGYAEQGDRVQDIAGIRVTGEMAEKFIRNLGYKDVQINTVFHQYMAAFPETQKRAEELIYNSAMTAAFSRATRVIVKTPVEALRIPTVEDNLLGMSLTLKGVSDAAREPQPVEEARLAEECAMIRREVEAIVESVIMCGKGSVAAGVVKAVEKGYIDIPFSPSIYNRGEVMTARDTWGSVRFLSTGKLQFDKEIRQFHEEKMQTRRRAEGLWSSKGDYLLVEQDVMRIPRGKYDRWPLQA
jgi:methylaspartate mutase epsilon subunit